MFNKTTLQFLELLKAGLWGSSLNVGMFDIDSDWEVITTSAIKQTVTGLISVGFMQLPRTVVPRRLKLYVTRETADIEDRNKLLNRNVEDIFRWLERMGYHAWLIKGQGVAQDYADPSKRVTGDIDILFPCKSEYEDARKRMIGMLHEDELCVDGRQMLNLEFKNQGVYIEFHGKVSGEINHKTNKHMPDFVAETSLLPARRWGIVALPPVRFDAVFIFSHLARHYFGGGIGLRQVCDWMRFLHAHCAEIDRQQLHDDLVRLGLMKIWQTFAAMAVDLLGCPVESMPFYDARFSEFGMQIFRFIMESGNFGHHDERTKSNSNYYFVRRFTAFWGHLIMKFRNFAVFPEESVYGIPSFLSDGLKRTFSRQRNLEAEND